MLSPSVFIEANCLLLSVPLSQADSSEAAAYWDPIPHALVDQGLWHCFPVAWKSLNEPAGPSLLSLLCWGCDLSFRFLTGAKTTWSKMISEVPLWAKVQGKMEIVFWTSCSRHYSWWGGRVLEFHASFSSSRAWRSWSWTYLICLIQSAMSRVG